MKLEGERTLPGTPDKVWEMLLDPDVLVTAIPGCEKLERVGEDEYEGRISAKIGAIQSTFDTAFKIREKHPPESYKLDVKGQGSAGFVNGVADMNMAPDGADATRLSYTIDANVGGRLAQVGQRMVRATATTMIDRGFNDLRDRIEHELHRPAAEAPGQTAAAAAPPRQPSRSSVLKRVRNFFSAFGTFLKAFFSSPPEAKSPSSAPSSASQPSEASPPGPSSPGSSPLPAASPSAPRKEPGVKQKGSGKPAPAGLPSSSGTKSSKRTSTKDTETTSASSGNSVPAGLPSSRGTSAPSQPASAQEAAQANETQANEAPAAEETTPVRSASWGKAPPGLPSSGRSSSSGSSSSGSGLPPGEKAE